MLIITCKISGPETYPSSAKQGPEVSHTADTAYFRVSCGRCGMGNAHNSSSECPKIDMWVGVDALRDDASEKVGFEDLQVIEIFKGGGWLAIPPCHTHANDSSRRWPHKSTC